MRGRTIQAYDDHSKSSRRWAGARIVTRFELFAQFKCHPSFEITQKRVPLQGAQTYVESFTHMLSTRTLSEHLKSTFCSRKLRVTYSDLPLATPQCRNLGTISRMAALQTDRCYTSFSSDMYVPGLQKAQASSMSNSSLQILIQCSLIHDLPAAGYYGSELVLTSKLQLCGRCEPETFRC